MRTKISRGLIIDASVARASGGEDAKHPTPKRCRDFLKTVLSICHHVVMTPAISDEWKKHRSNFARKWYVSMAARKKVNLADIGADDRLRGKIKLHVTHEKDCEAMLKDIHLIEAALATDQIVISHDENARRLYIVTAVNISELKQVAWINPDRIEEQPIHWLENRAKPEKKRMLGFWLKKRE